MKSKIVTAYWMDANGLPFQGSGPVRKERYLGSLIAYCQNLNLPIICYTHNKSLFELINVKEKYNLSNLEIKLLELCDVKFHLEINNIRYSNLDYYISQLDGRGCEIMWGKFDILQRELNDCSNIYWLDVGLQHPGILTWGLSKKYNKVEEHYDGNMPLWWADFDVYNYPNFFNHKLFEKLDIITKNKLCLITSTNPQISYPFQDLGIVENSFTTPYPVGAMIGGDSKIVELYVNKFWEYAKKILDNNTLVTEESIMKPSLDDMDKSNVLCFEFSNFHFPNHDKFHFEKWQPNWEEPKPFYMVWHDILNY